MSLWSVFVFLGKAIYGINSCILQLVVSLAFCLKRRIAVRRRLQRISKTHRAIGYGDVPKASHTSDPPLFQ
jgi:hypothetical protein